MLALPAHPELLRFSTGALPACERLAAWRDIFGRMVVVVEVEPLRAECFVSDVVGCQTHGLGVLFGSSDAIHLTHRRELISNKDVSFIQSHALQWTAAQQDRRPALPATAY
jgi:hypothetical protein